MTDNTDSFALKIWSGLFKKKHWSKMGNAIWLFCMFIDKVTKEENGKGYVLGGKPVKYEDFASEMPISQRQYLRMMDTLRDNGYIHTTQTPHGLKVVIHKSKKFSNRYDKKVTSPPSDTTNPSYRYDIIGIADVTNMSPLYIDNKVDPKRTKKEFTFDEFQEIWKELYPIFNLPDDSFDSYKNELKQTLERLGLETTMKAVEIFAKESDDHPPDGKIKQIADLLHWKKIDVYVAKIPKPIIYRYYCCPNCTDTIKINAETIGPYLSDRDEMTHCDKTRVEVTDTIKECRKNGFKNEQIRTVLKKQFSEAK